MKKKLIIMASVVASTALISSPVWAEDKVDENVIVPISAEIPAEEAEVIADEKENKEEVSDYIRFAGVISEIKKDGDKVTLIVEDEENDRVSHFPLGENSLTYSSATTNEIEHSEFKEGQHVEVFYDRHKPILMIYPPIIEPELVIAHDKEQIANVKVGKFDENWLSHDKELIIHIAEETVLLNQAGEKITKADLAGKELVVFYTISTLSLPGQTTPTKVIALDPLYDEVEEEEVVLADMDEANAHYEAVKHFVTEGVIKGYPTEDGAVEFRPSETITREQAAQLLMNALNLPVPENVNSVLKNLTDVSGNHYFGEAIAATYDAGIFKGSNGAFMGNKALTREQMATVLVQAFNLKDNGNKVDINLSNVNPTHRKNVQILANLGITNQLEDYKPKQLVTREQFATFLYRAMGY